MFHQVPHGADEPAIRPATEQGNGNHKIEKFRGNKIDVLPEKKF
jgi:hypothetical protein